MFHAFQNKGFQISFSNNLTISVMFGKGNYCENRHAEENSFDGSQDAEFVVFTTKPDGSRDDYIYVDGKNSYNGGWSSPEKVAKAISVVSEYKTENSLTELVKSLRSL